MSGSKKQEQVGQKRENEIQKFLVAAGWGDAARSHLAGDASNRRYERVCQLDGARAVLMDAPPDPLDQPLDGAEKSYGEIAHLARDCRPFVAIAQFLKYKGLCAPEIFFADFDLGFVLLEDLGDGVFGPLIDNDANPDDRARALYEAATDVLAEFHKTPVPLVLPIFDAAAYELPHYDTSAMKIETELLLDWYAPAKLDRDIDAGEREAFAQIWQDLFVQAAVGHDVLALRDFHSPNLLLVEGGGGHSQIGLIDFQDGLLGSPAYDLVSLAQDARRDVSRALEQDLVARYLMARPDLDADEFRTAYAVLGAQRNSKIMGIFCRLWKRDGKPGYLQHMPRLWDYMQRNLEHPALKEYKLWIDRNFSLESRK